MPPQSRIIERIAREADEVSSDGILGESRSNQTVALQSTMRYKYIYIDGPNCYFWSVSADDCNLGQTILAASQVSFLVLRPAC